MSKSAVAVALIAVLTCSPSLAQQACGPKAVGADGRPLKGSALTTYLRRCIAADCAARAVDETGKALAGAARAAFLKKCENY